MLLDVGIAAGAYAGIVYSIIVSYNTSTFHMTEHACMRGRAVVHDIRETRGCKKDNQASERCHTM